MDWSLLSQLHCSLCWSDVRVCVCVFHTRLDIESLISLPKEKKLIWVISVVKRDERWKQREVWVREASRGDGEWCIEEDGKRKEREWKEEVCVRVPSSILSLSLLLADSGVLWDLERCVFHHLMKWKGADDGLTKTSVWSLMCGC